MTHDATSLASIPKVIKLIECVSGTRARVRNSHPFICKVCWQALGMLIFKAVQFSRLSFLVSHHPRSKNIQWNDISPMNSLYFLCFRNSEYADDESREVKKKTSCSQRNSISIYSKETARSTIRVNMIFQTQTHNQIDAQTSPMSEIGTLDSTCYSTRSYPHIYANRSYMYTRFSYTMCTRVTKVLGLVIA